jgi:hypothetical protein
VPQDFDNLADPPIAVGFRPLACDHDGAARRAWTRWSEKRRPDDPADVALLDALSATTR